MKKYLERIVEKRPDLDKLEGVGGSPLCPLGKA